ncbi:MAG TPA: TetM/TetW/TetO/TetS family tetracycline resistance ribosomal protection protein [Candidatus Pullilachnospira intestinigallinarum]|nr:TetM/TetW/TetO/TetS family tetracycline resistance ribosomal protection protein [Candidatus Pullilachnospira intestinigallinarum]
MENTSGNKKNHPAAKPEKYINIGLLAHVDAGKTTLAEAILYLQGSIRKLGRVDHRDTFLDTDAMERARGITIFSKQARLTLGDWQVTLLDTPGHVDFSAEMERTLQVLDCAVLVISGADGVQSHVETLWRLLRRYQIPTFLFINKMDQPGTDREAILAELKSRLDDGCVDFGGSDQEAWLEELAMCDEALMERYLEDGRIETEDISRLIADRKVFPCYFGSALKNEGVDVLLDGIRRYARVPEYPEAFGAKVYKIGRDAQGARLTYLKVTGGCLRVKMPLSGKSREKEAWEEKTDQIRLYSGTGFQMVQEAPAGMVCAVTGLTKTYSGQGLGAEPASELPLLEPVLTYRLSFPVDVDVHGAYLKLRPLEEEIPELHMIWDGEAREIRVQVMGEVQIEILKNLIRERFELGVSFDAGSIVYKETIAGTVEGVGHFEPLRHYAEVHLLLEPGEPGSGLQFDSICSEDVLDRNWQRLVLTHLEEKTHRGVLTGSEITDMRILLASGRAHQKHTEGGDFRQATYRAVRQGLMHAKNVLLEPVYTFRLEVPSGQVGRAMTDLQQMHGEFGQPQMEGETAVLTGTAPVACLQGYPAKVTAYTAGRGRMSCTLGGYAPCHNSEEVIAAIGYDPEKDTENTADSVFCAHGAGFVVSWEQVPEYMHLESVLAPAKQEESRQVMQKARAARTQDSWITQEELEEIFVRTYGPIKERRFGMNRSASAIKNGTEKKRALPSAAPRRAQKNKKPEKEYLLVDGYNIIFAWEELADLARTNIESARNKLMDILCNYQGFRQVTVILVFDAYRVEGGQGEVFRYHNIYVVYTREAETADQYIEKTVHEIGKQYQVTVATSDATEQVIIMGQGARRLSARDLEEEVRAAAQELRRDHMSPRSSDKNYLLDHLPRELAEMMEDVRLGRKSLDGRGKTENEE